MLQAQTDMSTGSSLFHSCQAAIRFIDEPDAPNADAFTETTVCSSYIAGFTDAAGLSSSFCPAGAKVETIIRVYVLHVEKHPKLLDAYRGYGVAAALAEAYPCPTPKR